jgi:hypothetical protein
MNRYVDPVLVAVSDCLVLTALERAWSRTVPRSDRQRVSARDKHRGYVIVPIRGDRIDKALDGAWQLCQLLQHRHALSVHWDEWAALLDQYTRALIMMSQPHQTTALTAYLAPLGSAAVLTREYVAV